MPNARAPLTVAAAQHSAVFLNRRESVEKACTLIAEASEQGAKLIVFPEAVRLARRVPLLRAVTREQIPLGTSKPTTVIVLSCHETTINTMPTMIRRRSGAWRSTQVITVAPHEPASLVN